VTKTYRFILSMVFAIATILKSFSSDYGVSKLFNDKTFHFEALRVFNNIPSGGADAGEIIQTIKNIKGGDMTDWYDEWMKTAKRVEKIADEIKNDATGKGYAYARAFNYYRSAEFFMLADDLKKKEISKKMYETFYKSLDYLKVNYKIFEAPYEGSSLKAIYYPSNKNKPLIVIVSGYDSIQEEEYFLFAKAAIERGYPVLTYDGPGQGISIRERGLFFTHEWEKPNSAVLDKFIKDFGKPQKIILLGASLGGYFVSRVAAFDTRIDGIINYDVMYDFAMSTTWNYPGWLKKMMFDPKGVSPFVKSIFRNLMKTNTKVRWAMTQGSWTFGIKEPWDVVRNYQKYSIKDTAYKIKCDVLLLAGTKDHFVPMEIVKLNQQALVNARSVKTIVYDEESAGHEHCQVGASFLWQADVFEWLYEKFEYK